MDVLKFTAKTARVLEIMRAEDAPMFPADIAAHDETLFEKGSKSVSPLMNTLFKNGLVKKEKEANNFITIDKGSADGVKKDMGVVSGTGVVGIVYLTGEHYSVIIPVLSQQSNISCSIKGRGYFGYLHWTGGSPEYAYIDDIPRHAHFKLGDYIVTSGYSSVFPSGIIVGRIKHVYNSDNGMSYRLKITLSTDFARLRDVCVINDREMDKKLEILRAAEDSLKARE